MNTKLGKLMMGYGIFLVTMGLVGYLSNPDNLARRRLSRLQHDRLPGTIRYF